jgi:hypothetical protein
MISDETFFAWLDNELPEKEAAIIAEAVENDAGFRAKAEAHRALKEKLRGAFDPVLEQPVPESFSKLFGENADVIDFSAASKARQKRQSVIKFVSWQNWGALAATLVIGLVGGTFLRTPNGTIVTTQSGRLVANADLDSALNTQLASSQNTREDVRIGVTYRTNDGVICRSFVASAASGVACKNGSAWQIRGLFPSSPSAGGEYRMAGDNDQVAKLVDSTIVGEPLDATAESAARDRKWSGR